MGDKFLQVAQENDGYISFLGLAIHITTTQLAETTEM